MSISLENLCLCIVSKIHMSISLENLCLCIVSRIHMSISLENILEYLKKLKPGLLRKIYELNLEQGFI